MLVASDDEWYEPEQFASPTVGNSNPAVRVRFAKSSANQRFGELARLLLYRNGMADLRVAGVRARPPDDIPRRRASDRISEERFRYPGEEVSEVSCCTEEEQQQPVPAPESRAS